MKMLFHREKTKLRGVYKILLENFSDNRGTIVNLFDKDQFSQFKVTKLTKSRKNVLRGLHGDSINNKLIYCLKGNFHLVVVNYNKDSDQYLMKTQFDMDEDSNYAVFVPKGFLNGHYCMSDDCLFYYKWSESYVTPENQFSVRWNDKTLDIQWPLIEDIPILSSRDENSKILKEKK